MIDFEYIKKLYTEKTKLTVDYKKKLLEIDKEIDKYRPSDILLKKGDVVYDYNLNEYKIVAVNKETYRLDNGTTLSKDGLTNWRGWGFSHPDWQYYYSKEHRDLLDFFDKHKDLYYDETGDID